MKMTKYIEIKKILIEKFGYDFNSDWWTDELKTLFDETNLANEEFYNLQNAALIERVKELEEYCKELCGLIKSEIIIIQNNTDDECANWVYMKANNLLTKHK